MLHSFHMDGCFISRTEKLCQALDLLKLDFDGYIYNPLEYAWNMYEKYQDMALSGENRVMFIGMNPGPDGMAQTGVPFGSVSMVRSYLGLEGETSRPEREHPKKPVLGFSTAKDEPSGRHFWSMIRSRWPDARDFFSFATVQNFCPLAFLDRSSGRNITPDRLSRRDRALIEPLCLDYLDFIITEYGVETAVAIGNYAERQLLRLGKTRVVKIMHPSPANPSAHIVWADDGRAVLEMLEREGVL